MQDITCDPLYMPLKPRAGHASQTLCGWLFQDVQSCTPAPPPQQPEHAGYPCSKQEHTLGGGKAESILHVQSCWNGCSGNDTYSPQGLDTGHIYRDIGHVEWTGMELIPVQHTLDCYYSALALGKERRWWAFCFELQSKLQTHDTCSGLTYTSVVSRLVWAKSMICSLFTPVSRSILCWYDHVLHLGP